MTPVDVVDETFLAVPPQVVARAVADPARWRRWWPDLALRVHHDRGAEGLRWTVAGALAGSMELWLEPVLDGTVVHYYLRADLPGADTAQVVAAVARRRRAAKAVCFALKAELEAGRAPGEPPEPCAPVAGSGPSCAAPRR